MKHKKSKWRFSVGFDNFRWELIKFSNRLFLSSDPLERLFCSSTRNLSRQLHRIEISIQFPLHFRWDCDDKRAKFRRKNIQSGNFARRKIRIFRIFLIGFVFFSSRQQISHFSCQKNERRRRRRSLVALGNIDKLQLRRIESLSVWKLGRTSSEKPQTTNEARTRKSGREKINFPRKWQVEQDWEFKTREETRLSFIAKIHRAMRSRRRSRSVGWQRKC